MKKFLNSNRNVLLVGLSLFVISVTVLLIVLNNSSLSEELKADLIHENNNKKEELIYYGPFNIDEGMYLIVGLDGKVLSVNEKKDETLGFNQEEMEGQLFFNYVHPEDLSSILSSFGKVLSNKESKILLGPFRMKNSDNRYIVTMLSMQPILIDGNLKSVVVFIKKILPNQIPDQDLNQKDVNPQDEEKSSENGDSEKENINEIEKRLVVEKLV